MVVEITESRETQLTHEDLRTRVFRWLRSHPLDAKKGKRGKLLKLASDLGIDYKTHRATLQQYSSDFMTELQFGVGPKSPSFHRVVVGAYAPKCLDRRVYPGVVEQALKAGWEFTQNRNREMVWNKDRALGRVRWFETGKVLAHVRKPLTEDRKRMLLTSAFGLAGLIFDLPILVRFIQSFDMVAWHEVHRNPTGEKLPYMKIVSLSETHGVVTKVGDLSHPDCVEHEVIRPKWIENVQLLQEQTLKTIAMNTEQVQVFQQFLKDLSAPRMPPKRDRSIV